MLVLVDFEFKIDIIASKNVIRFCFSATLLVIIYTTFCDTFRQETTGIDGSTLLLLIALGSILYDQLIMLKHATMPMNLVLVRTLLSASYFSVL